MNNVQAYRHLFNTTQHFKVNLTTLEFQRIYEGTGLDCFSHSIDQVMPYMTTLSGRVQGHRIFAGREYSQVVYVECPFAYFGNKTRDEVIEDLRHLAEVYGANEFNSYNTGMDGLLIHGVHVRFWWG